MMLSAGSRKAAARKAAIRAERYNGEYALRKTKNGRKTIKSIGEARKRGDRRTVNIACHKAKFTSAHVDPVLADTRLKPHIMRQL